MTCKQIVNQRKKLPGFSALLVFLLLLVLFIPYTASSVEESKVSGYLAIDGKRIELTSGIAYPGYDNMTIILITDKAIPEGRGKAFVDRFLAGTGLMGIAVALKPPDGDAAGAPALVYAWYLSGDGSASYNTRAENYFLLDGVSVLPEQVSGRFHGEVVYTPEEIAVDVSFNIPIKEPPAPKPLPEDGGEPGKVFLRIIEALRDKDVPAVKKLCAAELRDFLMDEQEAAEGFVDYLAETYRGEEVRIVGGTWDNIDRATLEIEVVDKDKQVRSEEADMELEDDGWKLGQ